MNLKMRNALSHIQARKPITGLRSSIPLKPSNFRRRELRQKSIDEDNLRLAKRIYRRAATISRENQLQSFR